MESVTYNDSNIPIEVLYSYYRGDKYRFEIELGRYRLNGNGLNLFPQTYKFKHCCIYI